MVELPIELATGEKKVVSCPTKLKDLTTEKFQRIALDWSYDGTFQSLVKLFGILTDQRFSTYLESTSILMATILRLTQFVFFMDGDLLAMEKPKEFRYNGRVIPIPSKLGRLTLGQNLQIKQALKGNPRGYIALALAVYLQPIIDGTPFDEERMAVLQKEFEALPITETYHVGFFYSSQRTPSGSVLDVFLPLTRKIMKGLNFVRRLQNRHEWNSLSRTMISSSSLNSVISFLPLIQMLPI